MEGKHGMPPGLLEAILSNSLNEGPGPSPLFGGMGGSTFGMGMGSPGDLKRKLDKMLYGEGPTPERILDLYDRFNIKYDFNPRQLVQFKEGLSDCRSIAPFVVLEVLDEPIINDSTDCGSNGFHQRLDIVVGVVTSGDKIFCRYYMDSRRLEPYNYDTSKSDL